MTTEKIKQILLNAYTKTSDLHYSENTIIKAMTEAVNAAIDECAESFKVAWYETESPSILEHSITKNKIK